LAPPPANALYSLGPDALPALRRVTPMRTDSKCRRAAEAFGMTLASQLREELRDWRRWTLRCWRTWNAVDPISCASAKG
jgi:hypothetical protein